LSGRVNKPGRQKGRRGKLIWVFGAVASVSALLYLEQTALLYVLSTLAVCGLMLVVAFSDLEGRDKEMHESNLNDPAATADDNEMTTAPAPHRVRRVTKRRRHDVA
jgi:hypothetical protein